MSTLTTLPPELLYQILEAVIDVPFVLDTTLPTDTCYWHWHPLSHDSAAYAQSEAQRLILRLVCQSWKQFADTHKYRWFQIEDNSTLPVHIKDMKLLKQALEEEETRMKDGITEGHGWNKPRRIDLRIFKWDTHEVAYKIISSLSIKLTTLFIACFREQGEPLFKHLISHRASLPNLYSLMLTAVDYTLKPLQIISTSFPRLQSLTLNSGTFPSNPTDKLILPELESLYLTNMPLDSFSIEEWSLPSLLRLLIPINGTPGDAALRIIQAHGKKLIFLRLESPARPISLPSELWKHAPSLKEIVARLSSVELHGPIPSTHPLKYVVSISPNANLARPPRGTHAILLRNVSLLTNSVELLIIARLDWFKYYASLHGDDTRGGEDLPPDEGYLEEIERICLEKGIKLEDEGWNSREEFLSMVTEVTERISSRHGLTFGEDEE